MGDGRRVGGGRKRSREKYIVQENDHNLKMMEKKKKVNIVLCFIENKTFRNRHLPDCWLLVKLIKKFNTCHGDKSKLLRRSIILHVYSLYAYYVSYPSLES